MPYPSKIDKETIVATASQWIEQDGADKLSLNKLAASFGVKTPSLYRYVGGRDDLLREVNLHTIADLSATLVASIDAGQSPPRRASQQLAVVMQVYRTFIHNNPNRYRLAFNGNDAQRPDEEMLVQLVQPVQQIVAALVGEASSLTVLRGAMALVHGYAMLEIDQILRRGGDLDRDFATVVAAYIAGSVQFAVG